MVFFCKKCTNLVSNREAAQEFHKQRATKDQNPVLIIHHHYRTAIESIQKLYPELQQLVDKKGDTKKVDSFFLTI